MKAQKGFTLTELIVVSAIVAILLGIGVPSYRYITNSYRMSGEVNSLLGDLQYARAEAIKEGQPVTVCTSADGATCAGGNAWSIGWIVFSDANGNRTVDAATDTVLHVQAPFTGTTPDSFVAAGAVGAVTFNREGFATTVAGFNTTTVRLTEQSGNGAWTRCLSINPVGMVSTMTHVMDPVNCP